MTRLFMTLLAALFGAVLMHGLVILMLPTIGALNMVTITELAGGGRDVVALDDPKSDLPSLAFSDPSFRHFSCFYNLEDGPYRITANGNAEFWTVALFDSDNINRFSLSSDGNENVRLDFLVATQSQKNFIEENTLSFSNDTIFAVVPDTKGAFILRIFRPEESYDGLIEDLAKSIKCDVIES